ncbi:MAG: Type I phosphodiesterase / nucleotide pyrophosphatase [Chloroflexi bacterium ADurb.Bin325]|nr:MAG: Type I phosphodiesterase / nucleotide pyrophosphatase [Chloroflexi bacterium ADurb.Bin325]
MFQLDPAFVAPAYDGRSFAALPRSIAGLLTGRQPILLAPDALPGRAAPYGAVLLIVVDGFGWRFVEPRLSYYPALQRFAQAGRATKFTAQFPTTTAAHVTTLQTGQEVGQHGVYEWQYYEPEVGAVVTPLLYSYAGTKEREQLRKAKIDPRRILPTRTLYQDLAELGVRTTIFQHREYLQSTYTEALLTAAQPVGHRMLAEALVNVRQALARAEAPAYFVLYYDRIDMLAHEYGPNSPHVAAEIDLFLTALERHLLAVLAPQQDTLVLLTADHGFMETDPATCVYINLDERFAGYERYLVKDDKGRPREPAGSARDYFLYVDDARLDEAQAFFAERLAGVAQVARTADLAAAGFFGSQPPSDALRARLGNLVILPYHGKTVWWYEKERFEQRFYGHHGGLTRQELEIPLLALAIPRT